MVLFSVTVRPTSVTYLCTAGSWTTPYRWRTRVLTLAPSAAFSSSDQLKSLTCLARLAPCSMSPNCAAAGLASPITSERDNIVRMNVTVSTPEFDVEPLMRVWRPASCSLLLHALLDHHLEDIDRDALALHHDAAERPQWPRACAVAGGCASLMMIEVPYSLFSDSSLAPRFTASPITV